MMEVGGGGGWLRPCIDVLEFGISVGNLAFGHSQVYSYTTQKIVMLYRKNSKSEVFGKQGEGVAAEGCSPPTQMALENQTSNRNVEE